MSIIIRREKLEDDRIIKEVTVAAFLEAPHAAHTEQFIVGALRDSGALSVSLVAERQGQIVGHVALSPVTVSDGASDWYGLGPISVVPNEQGKGIGSRLMHQAIEELKQLNANGCVLLGDPGYYHRFGFISINGLVLPGAPVEYFQALLIQGVYPQGTVAFSEAFSAQG